MSSTDATFPGQVSRHSWKSFQCHRSMWCTLMYHTDSRHRPSYQSIMISAPLPGVPTHSYFPQSALTHNILDGTQLSYVTKAGELLRVGILKNTPLPLTRKVIAMHGEPQLSHATKKVEALSTGILTDLSDHQSVLVGHDRDGRLLLYETRKAVASSAGSLINLFSHLVIILPFLQALRSSLLRYPSLPCPPLRPLPARTISKFLETKRTLIQSSI